MINGHVYVEMGDGLKWATCNVGADKPEKVGTLFAWGVFMGIRITVTATATQN